MKIKISFIPHNTALVTPQTRVGSTRAGREGGGVRNLKTKFLELVAGALISSSNKGPTLKGTLQGSLIVRESILFCYLP